MSMQTAQHPECFGKLWDDKQSECAGGYDSGFVGTNGSHIRPKCDFFESCKIRVMLAKNNQQQQAGGMVPPSALLRQQNQQPYPQQYPYPYQPPWNPWAPPQQPPVPGRQPTGQPAQQNQQMAPPGWQQFMAAPQPPGMMPPWMMQQMMQQMMPPWGMPMPNPMYPQQVPFQMQTSPIQMMPVYYDMPAYLSVPEARRKGEGFWRPMGRELLRGMGKAFGHSISSYFDKNSF